MATRYITVNISSKIIAGRHVTTGSHTSGVGGNVTLAYDDTVITSRGLMREALDEVWKQALSNEALKDN